MWLKLVGPGLFRLRRGTLAIGRNDIVLAEFSQHLPA